MVPSICNYLALGQNLILTSPLNLHRHIQPGRSVAYYFGCILCKIRISTSERQVEEWVVCVCVCVCVFVCSFVCLRG